MVGFLNPLSQLDISPFPIYPPVLFVADQQVISNNRSLFIPFLYISTMMCSQSIGRPSCYFSAWGAGSGQASSRCSALCTCKQACRRLNFLLLSTRYSPVAGSGSVCPVPPSTTQQPVRVCVRVLVHQLAVMSFAGTSPVPNVYPRLCICTCTRTYRYILGTPGVYPVFLST